MYCPRCGQQLASEIRFCSRCGLPMNVIAEVVAQGGLLPGRHSTNPIEKKSSGQPGMRLGAKLLFLSVVLVPLCFGFSILVDSPGPLILPVTVFLVGAFWLIYSGIFSEDPLTLNRQNQTHP